MRTFTDEELAEHDERVAYVARENQRSNMQTLQARAETAKVSEATLRAALQQAERKFADIGLCEDDAYRAMQGSQDARAALAASDGAWLEEKLAGARREQAETDFAAWVEALADEGETSHPDVARAVAEHDAKVRAEFGGWIPQADAQAACEAARTQVRAAALRAAQQELAKIPVLFDDHSAQLFYQRALKAIDAVAATPSAAPRGLSSPTFADGLTRVVEAATARAAVEECWKCSGTGRAPFPGFVVGPPWTTDTCGVCSGTGEVKR